MMDKNQDTETQGIEDGLKSLINAQLLLGKEVVKLVTGVGGNALDRLGGIKMPRGKDCCDVPEPCWMPLSVGEVYCQLCPGDKGSVCLIVTNGDFRPHSYQIAASGKSAAEVSFSQTDVVLGPKERIAVTATFNVPRDGKPDDDCRCLDHDLLLWVRGCKNHYLRWTITEAAQSKACCSEVVVNDDPDYVLHWYDHFYMPRPCFGPVMRTPPAVSVGAVK